MRFLSGFVWVVFFEGLALRSIEIKLRAFFATELWVLGLYKRKMSIFE